jgi:KUP system potassium uptake protein
MVPPGWPMMALVGLATLAAVIASQALISGAYSLTHQAIHMGLFPRVEVRHTSATAEGQIYLPGINWALAVSSIALVLQFRSSSGLAAAYGIAVCGTMAITSVMFGLVARERWQWSSAAVLALVSLFLLFDLGFLAANLLKFMHGGYVPVIIAIAISLVMLTWNVGRSNLAQYYAQRTESWSKFAERLDGGEILRPNTVGVFMASDARGVPVMVLHQAERIRAVPARAFILTVRFERVPHVPPALRIAEITDLGHGFHRIVARYGFMQHPEVPPVIEAALNQLGSSIPPRDVTYYLGLESLVADRGGNMGPVLERLFRRISRNALPATAYFRLPPVQVVEIGLQIDL